MTNYNIVFSRFSAGQILIFITFFVLGSCAKFNNSPPKISMVDKFFEKLGKREIYVRMPMDEFLSVINFDSSIELVRRGEHGGIMKIPNYPYNSLIHQTLPGKWVDFGKSTRNGQNVQGISVSVRFYELDGEWLLGGAEYTRQEDEYFSDPKRIFDKDYPIELRGYSMTFEKFLVSTRGNPKQKLLFNKLSNGQINGQQFFMEHGKWTGQNMQAGTRVITTPSNPPSSPKPSSNARTSRPSYEEAKKQLIKRLMEKEITREECVKLMGELKVRYGK